MFTTGDKLLHKMKESGIGIAELAKRREYRNAPFWTCWLEAGSRILILSVKCRTGLESASGSCGPMRIAMRFP
ncbi:hypothetical protein SAMN05216521_10788 [Enterocloster clostridioformis]|uniref:Uncharacterized protein n=1 Tax=Enterocloster clostridioformis TaxID=1531 RepID=A0A1I0JZU9_9FIRM|nr:hypothetical protein SAMN05216521_10788 [Enterocloster clostridioformis]SEW48245.1 hypothetical protein SAMN05216528_10748 [Enterocloster clostridioformis]